jgi:hypothetical protein
MKEFRVYTDEQIKVWQRVGLVIRADSEQAVQAILNDPKLFEQAMAEGQIEYNGEVDPYWDTEDHLDWEHDAPTINEMKETA